MTPLTGATCEICGERLSDVSVSRNQICPACQELRPHFNKAVAYGAYDGELRDLIHLLKYEQVEPAAGVLGRMLAQAIQKLPRLPIVSLWFRSRFTDLSGATADSIRRN
jgi:predicted amidophosphoribosyltransferase